MAFMENVPKTDKPSVYLKEFVSKNGSPYVCMIVEYKGYEKRVFLNDAERFVYLDLEVKK